MIDWREIYWLKPLWPAETSLRWRSSYSLFCSDLFEDWNICKCLSDVLPSPRIHKKPPALRASFYWHRKGPRLSCCAWWRARAPSSGGWAASGCWWRRRRRWRTLPSRYTPLRSLLVQAWVTCRNYKIFLKGKLTGYFSSKSIKISFPPSLEPHL